PLRGAPAPDRADRIRLQVRGELLAALDVRDLDDALLPPQRPARVPPRARRHADLVASPGRRRGAGGAARGVPLVGEGAADGEHCNGGAADGGGERSAGAVAAPGRRDEDDDLARARSGQLDADDVVANLERLRALADEPAHLVDGWPAIAAHESGVVDQHDVGLAPVENRAQLPFERWVVRALRGHPRRVVGIEPEERRTFELGREPRQLLAAVAFDERDRRVGVESAPGLFVEGGIELDRVDAVEMAAAGGDGAPSVGAGLDERPEVGAAAVPDE